MQRSGDRMKRTALFGGSVAMLLVGCGGGSGGQCAGDVTCGGNVVGTWDIISTCVSGSPTSGEGCGVQSFDASNLRETGSITFDNDGTYSVTFVVSGKVEETITESCLSNGAISITCDDFNTLLQTSVMKSADGAIASASCHGVSVSCACSFEFATKTMTESGTYIASGGTVTTTASGGSPEAQGYCVQGSIMTVGSSSMSTFMGGMSTMTGADSLRARLTLKKR
jgi:hypothetical protein